MVQESKVPNETIKQKSLASYGLKNKTFHSCKNYLFESILLLWVMLFYLVLMIVLKHDDPNAHFFRAPGPVKLSGPVVALTALFFCAPLCMVSLGAATRSLHCALHNLHDESLKCSQISRVFLHISWLLYLVMVIALSFVKI